LKKVARIAVLATIILFISPTLTANGSTTRVWEPVNIAGSGLDTLANNAQATVSFGKAGRYQSSWANVSPGVAFYVTNGSCGAPTCTTSDIDGTVRFTFGERQTHLQIHYAYVESDDPERVVTNLGAINLSPEGSGGVRVSSTGALISGQPAADNFTTGGLIYPTSGIASGTVELRFPAPGVEYIEFQNDFPTQNSFRSEYGENLVGVSLPVEYAQVTFNANSGSGAMSAQSAARATNLSVNSLTYSGYTFAGWNTAANGSGTPFADGASFPFTADTVLYAQWTLIPVATPSPTPPAPTPASSTTATQAPAEAPTTLLATTGADISQSILIGGTASVLAISGFVVFGVRRKLNKS
jgi:uncharacterized repeat protein (TIGR02543 family)